MNAVEFFAAARAHKRHLTGNTLDALTQQDVDGLNAVLRWWEPKDDGRRISQRGCDLMHRFEGCRLTAYPDPGSSNGEPWTIGWGSTGPDIRPGTVWTQAQADARFRQDLRKFEGGVVARLGEAPTTQSQFDAMVSLAYNIGLAAFGGSTLLKKHNAGDYEGAANAFRSWRFNDGKEMRGLLRRREAEAALYGSTA